MTKRSSMMLNIFHFPKYAPDQKENKYSRKTIFLSRTHQRVFLQNTAAGNASGLALTYIYIECNLFKRSAFPSE